MQMRGDRARVFMAMIRVAPLRCRSVGGPGRPQIRMSTVVALQLAPARHTHRPSPLTHPRSRDLPERRPCATAPQHSSRGGRVSSVPAVRGGHRHHHHREALAPLPLQVHVGAREPPPPAGPALASAPPCTGTWDVRIDFGWDFRGSTLRAVYSHVVVGEEC